MRFLTHNLNIMMIWLYTLTHYHVTESLSPMHTLTRQVIEHIKSQADTSVVISIPDLDISQLCSKADTCMRNPLHVAAEMGHLEPLKLLLEHAGKEVIDANDIVGRTVMHFAAENGHVR